MDFQSLVELAPWTTIAQICNLLLQIFLRFQQVQRCLCHMRGGTRIDLFGQIRQHFIQHLRQQAGGRGIIRVNPFGHETHSSFRARRFPGAKI